MENKPQQTAYMYVVKCSDQSLYTGYTTDIERRIKTHNAGKGAKYTKSHKVKEIESVWRSKDKSLACKLEYQIKQLPKVSKEKIIAGEKLTTYLKGKIDCRNFFKIKLKG
jgi:putative endonuclease